jgi:hypothetical protein
MVKSAQPGEGGGCTPFIFHSIYHHEQSCVVPVCSSWEGRYTPPISPPPFSPLCCWPSLRGYWHITVWYWISLVARKSLRICPIWRRGRARDIPDETKMKKTPMLLSQRWRSASQKPSRRQLSWNKINKYCQFFVLKNIGCKSASQKFEPNSKSASKRKEEPRSLSMWCRSATQLSQKIL